MRSAMIAILTGLVASAAVVVLAGTRLARSGDVITARTRLGGLWVGSVLLAAATSLPERTTDLSAIRFGVPDLAAGDLFGSSMANMLILAFLDLVPRVEIFRRAALDTVLTATLAIALNALAAMFVLLHLDIAVLGVGPGSIVLAGGYLLGMRIVFRNSAIVREAAAVVETVGDATPLRAGASALPGRRSLRRAVGEFAIAAVVILVAAPIFAAFAKALAGRTGLATSFVGTWLVGFTTSLPELVTSLAAVRLKAYDLAVGNLFGSNAVNILMFPPLDAAHRAGPVLDAVSQVHAVSALAAIVLIAIGLAAIVHRTKGRFALFEPSSALMVLVYAFGIGLVYLHGRVP
jgi:cation:H+ antiporter